MTTASFDEKASSVDSAAVRELDGADIEAQRDDGDSEAMNNKFAGLPMDRVTSGSKQGPPLELLPRDAVSPESVIGGVSAVLWALILVVLLKTVIFSLPFAMKEGEGGVFALFTGLYPPDVLEPTVITSAQAEELSARSREPSLMEGTAAKKHPLDRVGLHWALLAWTLFGTGMTLADGFFTPAVSLSAAIEGMATNRADLQHVVAPLTAGVYVLLFLAQMFNITRVSSCFSPIVFIWLLLLGASGIYNVTFYPGIFRALAILYFTRSGDYDRLSGVILAVTGVEALFANLGQFSNAAIRISCLGFVLPCLSLAYLGQGARLIGAGADAAFREPIFWHTIPGGANQPFYWITFVFAILATVVTSQSLIMATFAVVQQLVAARCLPPFKIKYISDQDAGAIYIPIVNLLLMIAVVAIVLGFKTFSGLVNAYAFGVATVMIVTTLLLAVQIYYVKGLALILAIAFFLFFGFIDALFWGATLRKVPHGAWLPLALGGLFALLMLIWRWGKDLERDFDRTNRTRLRNIFNLVQEPEMDNSPDQRAVSSDRRGSWQSAHATPGLAPPGSTLDMPSHVGLQRSPSSRTRDIRFPDEKPMVEQSERATGEDDASEKRMSAGCSTSGHPLLSLANPQAGASTSTLGGGIRKISDRPWLGAPHIRSRRAPGSGAGGRAPPSIQPLNLVLDADEPLLLPRLQCTAVFQRAIGGVGAPHSFVSLLRHMPALPRVVIFLETRQSALAHVPYTDRYFVRKIPGFPGFYSATLRLGFRDALDLTQSTDAIVSRICVIERHLNDDGLAESRVEEIVVASRIRSHFLTQLYIKAKPVAVGPLWLRPMLTFCRKIMLQEFYRRVAAIFPEESGWNFDEDAVLRVGVSARL